MNAKLSSQLLLLAGALLFTACSNDDDDNTPPAPTNTLLTATLNGAQEIPATNTPATGTFAGTYNPTTQMLDYEVTYSGLKGKVAAGHIHKGAPGVNGPVRFPFSSLTSPIKGSLSVSQAIADSMANGFFYANIHSDSLPNGEIRGDIKKK